MFPIFFLLLLLPTTAYSVQFQITQFDVYTPDIQYRGYAKPSQGQVDISDYESFRVGWTIYAKKVPIWDLDTGKLTDFSTRFSFTINTTSKRGNGERFRISINYHFRDNQKRQMCRFFILFYFFRVRGNNILTFFFFLCVKVS